MSSRYYGLNDFFKDKFGTKVYKVSLDGGFTCPNRDGSVATGGCLFCSDSGSGEFTGSRVKNISEQIDEQLDFMNKKIGDGPVIAYFQNFTNTYGEVGYLREIFSEALSHPRVVGLAIGTRPDCLPSDVLDLLEELNNKYFIWIELGLQTVDDNVAMKFNRGYKTEVYYKAARDLNERGIKFVTHLILGLQDSTRELEFNSAMEAIKAGSFGIKLHLLYFLKETRMASLLNMDKITPLSEEEYVETVVNILRHTPRNIVIHRLTGDAKRSELLAPMWSGNKIGVLNSIEKKLKELGAVQGDLV